jgi:hypothetical protein
MHALYIKLQNHNVFRNIINPKVFHSDVIHKMHTFEKKLKGILMNEFIIKKIQTSQQVH